VRRARAAAAAAAALLLAACGGGDGSRDRAAPAPEPPRRFVVGEGRTSATVFTPRGGSRGTTAVVFLHGWGATLPRTYRPWIDHLVRRGHTVVYPRYQDSALDPPPEALPAAVIGIRSALARVDERDVVAVGHSAGGALSADLAAIARRVRLPVPRVVLSLYPGRRLNRIPARLPAGDLRVIPETTRVVALAGAADRVVGSRVARDIARRTGGTFRLVRDPRVADHLGPQRATAASRRTFWALLDRLIEQRR